MYIKCVLLRMIISQNPFNPTIHTNRYSCLSEQQF